MAAINESPSCGSLRYLSDKIFSPFELNDSDQQYGNDCLDPDLNYFSSYNQYISGCNYFVESSFNSEISKSLNKKQNFSLCHLNIRSIRKNLGSLEFTLENSDRDNTVYLQTEGWFLKVTSSSLAGCTIKAFNGFIEYWKIFQINVKLSVVCTLTHRLVMMNI